MTEKQKELLEREKSGSFRYFEECTNWDTLSKGYGLTLDRYPNNPKIASIATTGLGLSALAIGVESGYITREEAEKRVWKTLQTVQQMKRTHGFWVHFINQETTEQEWNSEVSIIDSAIFIAGALVAGAYFGGKIEELATQLYNEMEWTWFINPEKKAFYMGYWYDRGFPADGGSWEKYDESLLMHVLAAGSPTYPVSYELYDSFIREKRGYKDGEPFIYSWFGSLFTYQFPQAFVNFKGKKDKDGVDWFENSLQASKASIAFSRDNQDKYKGWDVSFGQSATDTPKGYVGPIGFPPSFHNDTSHQNDGTLPTGAAIASIVFTPEESLKALESYFEHPEMIGAHGLQSAINLTENWFAPDSLGLDKGFNLIMIANFENNFVWNLTDKIPAFRDGLANLSIK